MKKVVLVETDYPYKFSNEVELLKSREVIDFIANLEEALNQGVDDKAGYEFVRCQAYVFHVFDLLELPFFTLSPYETFVNKVEFTGVQRLDSNELIAEDKQRQFDKKVEQAKDDFKKAAFKKYDKPVESTMPDIIDDDTSEEDS